MNRKEDEGPPPAGFSPDPTWLANGPSTSFATLQSLCARVSHALRNPLSGVLLNAQMMAEEIPEHSSLHLYLRDILEGSQMMEKTLHLLLEFTAPQPCQPRRVSVRDTLAQIFHGACLRPWPDAIRVQTTYAPDLREAHADPEHVHNILLHLLRNAVDAMPSGGEIRLACRNISFSGEPDSGHPGVEVDIQDTGAGIPKELLPRVFEPFFTTSPKKIGLGLSIVALLCEINHGRVILESHQGKGTRVRVHLPAVSGTSSPHGQPTLPSPHGPTSGRT